MRYVFHFHFQFYWWGVYMCVMLILVHVGLLHHSFCSLYAIRFHVYVSIPLRSAGT